MLAALAAEWSALSQRAHAEDNLGVITDARRQTNSLLYGTISEHGQTDVETQTRCPKADRDISVILLKSVRCNNITLVVLLPIVLFTSHVATVTPHPAGQDESRRRGTLQPHLTSIIAQDRKSGTLQLLSQGAFAFAVLECRTQLLL